MKIFLLIGALLVGSALAQNSAAPTKKPKATKPPKTGPVITCSNITHYQPRSCCPSFPKIENKETIKCGRQCAQKNDSHICCVSNCTLNEIKGINADGTFNIKAITEFFVKYSNSKNKTVYTSFVADVVQKCVAGLSNNKTCPPAEVAYCVYRQLFFRCPDMKNNTICKAVQDAAQTCPGYPFDGERPKSSKNETKQAEAKKKNDEKKTNGKNEKKTNENATDKNNKNQGGKTPKAANGTATAGNNTSAQPNKAQKGKAKEIKFPQTTTTSSGKSTTHKSESRDGALGPKGPGFQP